MTEKREAGGVGRFFTKAVKPRILPVVAAIVFIAVALLCRYGLTGFWSKYLGVIFWASMVYTLIPIIRPRSRIGLALALSLAVCWFVEFAQLTPVPAFLSSQHIILRHIFGAHFSVWDLPAYLAGVSIGAGMHALIRWRFGER